MQRSLLVNCNELLLSTVEIYLLPSRVREARKVRVDGNRQQRKNRARKSQSLPRTLNGVNYHENIVKKEDIVLPKIQKSYYF